MTNTSTRALIVNLIEEGYDIYSEFYSDEWHVNEWNTKVGLLGCYVSTCGKNLRDTITEAVNLLDVSLSE